MRIKLVFLYLMLFLFLGFMVFSVYMCISEQEEPVIAEPIIYEEMAEKVVSVDSEVPEIRSYDFSALKDENEDIVCWLRIPDMEINYPVVMGDDNEFYLKHSFTKEYSQFGCPFVDTRTPVGSDNMVIHGHNMGNNRTEMFSSLLLLQDPGYAIDHNKMYLAFSEEEGEKEYQLFSVMNLDTANSSFDYIISNFETLEDKINFIEFLTDNSLYVSDLEFDAASAEIVILSTCNRIYGRDNRLLVCGIKKL